MIVISTECLHQAISIGGNNKIPFHLKKLN